MKNGPKKINMVGVNICIIVVYHGSVPTILILVVQALPAHILDACPHELKFVRHGSLHPNHKSNKRHLKHQFCRNYVRLVFHSSTPD